MVTELCGEPIHPTDPNAIWSQRVAEDTCDTLDVAPELLSLVCIAKRESE